MHEDHGEIAALGELGHAGAGEGGDVVQDRRAVVERGAGATAALQVSTETGIFSFPADGRGRAAGGGVLLLRKPAHGRAGGFRAEVEDRRAVGLELQRLVFGGAWIEEFAAVGKGIGREVQDAHENRRGGVQEGIADLIHPRRKAAGVCGRKVFTFHVIFVQSFLRTT